MVNSRVRGVVKESEDESFGRRLRHRRLALGLTQAELGRKVGVSPRAISEIETGKTSPKSWRLPMLAHELRVSTSWLLAGEEPAAAVEVEQTHQLGEINEKLD